MYIYIHIYECTHNISHLKLHSLFNSFQNRSMRKQPKTEIKQEIVACRTLYTLAAYGIMALYGILLQKLGVKVYKNKINCINFRLFAPMTLYISYYIIPFKFLKSYYTPVLMLRYWVYIDA